MTSHSADAAGFHNKKLPDEGLMEKKHFLFRNVSLYGSPVVDFGVHVCKTCLSVEGLPTQNANCARPEETQHDPFS